MSKIVVVGSSNTDMVVKTKRFPEPGETIIGGDFFMFPGGKGANQAVAAARAGGDVTFICSVGDDVFGQNALKGYQKDSISIDFVKIVEGAASGVALITVNHQGENEIVVSSGTNGLLSPDHVSDALSKTGRVDIILTQLETPIETVEFLANYCNLTKLPLIINPAPAQNLNDAILDGLFLITPNETETKLLTGIAIVDDISMEMASLALLNKGVQNVIITLGSKGAFFCNDNEKFKIPSINVKAEDTTAAGDVFNGVLAVCLAQKKPWKDSIIYANKAAALSVTKMGAQSSAPYQEEINKFI
ncbi:MAG: ribokinase [Maribacter sp.]|nr:ribokinase [Maribacter sp.]